MAIRIKPSGVVDDVLGDYDDVIFSCLDEFAITNGNDLVIILLGTSCYAKDSLSAKTRIPNNFLSKIPSRPAKKNPQTTT